MNIETWGYVRHLFFVEQYSKKAIARKLNIDPKTVRRALKKETLQRENQRVWPSKFDEFQGKINGLLQSYPGMSAVRIHEEIRKVGYPGGISILRDYLRPLRTEKKTFLRIQTFPAEEAQVDWASTGRIGDRMSYCFLMVLSFSKMLYIEFFPDQRLESFLAGHLHAFQYFQGILKKIRYDSLKSVVLTRFGSNIQFNRRFLDFAAHHLFTPSVCNVRIHGTMKARPMDIFREKEQAVLIPLPKTDYDTRSVCAVKCSSQGLVRFDTNRYSVPFTHAAMTLTLKADDQFVSSYDKEQLIAQHERPHLKHQVIEDPRHVKGCLPKKPQGAIFKYRDSLLAVSESAKQYFEAMTKTELNITNQLKKIIGLIDLFGKTEVSAAMEQAIKHHAFDCEYLQNIILANRRKRAETKPPGSPSSKINPEMIRSTWVEERNPEIYDQYANSKEHDHEDPHT